MNVLSNGRYSVLLTEAGNGYSALDDQALTPWVLDRPSPGDGFYFFLRDLETGHCWSPGYLPTRKVPDEYAFACEDGVAELTRLEGDIESRMTTVVCADDDVELRALTLVNRSHIACHLDVTTYAEVVLDSPASFAAHPAFSKLFLATSFLEDSGALLVTRRPRDPRLQSPLWLVHQLGGAGHSVGYETDRARFHGRGAGTNDGAAALARGARLSRTVGSVLDPIVCMRRELRLEAGESAQVVALLGVAATREGAAGLARKYARLLAGSLDVRSLASRRTGTLNVPPEWLQRVQADGVRDAVAAQEAAVHEPLVTDELHLPAASAERLDFFNGLGGFTKDGGEYVIRIEPGSRPPQPWINVLANESFGCIASDSGNGCTWSVNSRLNRLTPWYNDPVHDLPADALYVRDLAAGSFWSATPCPTAAATYEVRHGFGYTRYLTSVQEVEQELTVFVPRTDPVRVCRMRLCNQAKEPHRLDLFWYVPFVLGSSDSTDTNVRWCDQNHAAFVTNAARRDYAQRTAFAAVIGAPDRIRHTTSRMAFLGAHGSMNAPAALGLDDLGAAEGKGEDACAAVQVPVMLAPGETIEVVWLLGECASESDARELLARYRAPGVVDHELAVVHAFWSETLSAVRVRTPLPALDLMVNGWLAYQAISCRLWARSAHYQSGGAFGFRDQLQDASAFMQTQPELMRAQILLHASHQFEEGDVLHWWHPPASEGIRTRFSDDLLWLPHLTSQYITVTGDDAVLDEELHWLNARPLGADEEEIYVLPTRTERRDTLYEHCCRAIDRSLTRGAHGLPLIGTGDWNDGMNRIGVEGRGESVWLGFFLYEILSAFTPLCAARHDEDRLDRYESYRQDLSRALNADGWDGSWYRRAFYDDGTPLGSADNDECRIDALAQAWAVLSKVGPAERAERAMDEVEKQLVSEENGMIRLLTPAFDKTPRDPGYIKGYLPGVRENGGQYTHAALWVIRALAELGRCERAAPLLEMLTPIAHTRTREATEVYQLEPYVVAADVYGMPPHVGRGGWSWYTGSAGWMLRVAVESVLGLRVHRGQELHLRPCVPAAWPGFEIRYRAPVHGTIYEIEFIRTDSAELSAEIDGGTAHVVDGAVVVPLAGNGGRHRVAVSLPRTSPLDRTTSE